MYNESTTITMKLEGITGESQVSGATGECDVLHYGYSAATPCERRGNGLAAAGAPAVSDMSITRHICGATAQLEKTFFEGTPIKTVVIKEYKLNAKNVLKPFIVITLTNVRIATHSVGVGGVEEMSFMFESVEREFFTQNDSGDLSSKGKTKYDIVKREVS